MKVQDRKNKNRNKSLEVTIFNLCATLELNKKVAKNILREYNEHHVPLSLKALGDSLSRSGIANKAINISIDQLVELPASTLLYIKSKEDFFILESCSKSKIIVLEPRSGRKEYSYEQFKNIWNGIAVLVSKNSKSNVIIQNKNQFNVFNISFVLFLSLTVIWFIISNEATFKLIDLTLLFLNAIGFLVSSNLIKFESAGILNGFGKFCHIGNNFDCLEVSKSKFSKVFKFLSLSELGLVYFTVLSILNIIIIIENNYTLIVYILIFNLTSVPLLLISLYYQSFKLKKWCLFCIIIDFLILLQIALIIGYYKIDLLSINLISIIEVCFGFIFAFFTLNYYKFYLKKRIYNKSNKGRLRVLTRDKDIIRSKINSKPIIDPKLDNLDIILGDINANNKILFLLNPYCKKCSETFKELQILLNTCFDYQFIIRLIPITNDFKKELKLLNLLYFKNSSEGSQYVYNILEGIYTDKRRNNYKNNYLKSNRSILTNQKTEKIESNENWCKMNNINTIPTVIINGSIFPNMFPAESLFYYLKN